MYVRLLSDVAPYAAGTLVDVDQTQAEELTSRDLARVDTARRNEPAGSGFYLRIPPAGSFMRLLTDVAPFASGVLVDVDPAQAETLTGRHLAEVATRKGNEPVFSGFYLRVPEVTSAP